MFEGLKDMGKLLKQAKEMKVKMKKVQDELKKTKVTGSSSGVEVIMTGELEVLEITIPEEFLNPAQKNRLEKEVKRAINDASKKAKDLASSKLSEVSGGLNIPGLDNL